MATLFQALYTYAYENRMRYAKDDKLKYNESCHAAERAQKEITEMLPKAGQVQFENYREKQNLMQLLELEAIFRAGLAIGLELSRLQ